MSKQPSTPPPGDKPVPTAPPPPPGWRHWLWPLALGLTLLLYFNLPVLHGTSPVTLSYSQFITDANAHQIKTVTFGSGSNGSNTVATGDLTNGKSYTTVIPGPASTALSAQLTADGVKSVKAEQSGSGIGSEILTWLILLLPLILLFYLFRRMARGSAAGLQGVLGVGRSKAKIFDAEQPKTKFDDVAGYQGAKAEIAEVVDFLRSPGRYQRAGAMAPRGVLMVGPPGRPGAPRGNQ